MIRVVHVIPLVGKGGASRALECLVAGIKQVDTAVSVDVIALKSVGDISALTRVANNVKVLSAGDQIADIIRGTYDIVHWWKTSTTSPLTSLVKKLGKDLPPLVTTLCQVPAAPSIGLSPIEVEVSNSIVFICNAARNHSSVEGVPKDITRMIYFGSSNEIQRPAIKKGNSRLRIATGGALSKLHKKLIETAARFEFDFEFDIVGWGDKERRRIESEIGNRQLTNVRLFREMAEPDWYQFLSSVDIFCYQLDPKKEYSCLDRVLRDVMLHEIPVVLQAKGGPRELVRHEETGFIAESIDDVVRDCARLAGDEKLRRSMGEAGRKRVLNFFDHLDTAEKYVELYREQLTLPNSRNSAGQLRQLPIHARVVYAINFLREKIASRIPFP